MESTKQSRRPLRGILATLTTLAVILGQARPSDAESGALTQLPAPDACILEEGDGVCADGVGLYGAADPAVSPDGKNVYVPGMASNAITVFSRDRVTGALTQLPAPDGCLAVAGDGVTCTSAVGLHGASSAVVSRDGKHVYVGASPGGIGVFARDRSTGKLMQLPGPDGCLLPAGGGTTGCADIAGPIWPGSLVLSGDGKHLYAASLNGDAVAVFARDRTTGALTQLPPPAGCVAENGDGVTCTDAIGLDGPDRMTLGKSGKELYVASYHGDSVAIFARDRTTGALTQFPAPNGCLAENGDGVTCTDAVGLDGPRAVAISSNGRQAYVASQQSHAIAIFARDPSTGMLTQYPAPAGCLQSNGDGIACSAAVSMNGPTSIKLTKNGRHAYVAAVNSHAVVALARDKKTGALTQLAVPDGCVSGTGDGTPCKPGLAVGSVFWLAMPDNGKHVYATSYGDSSVAVFAVEK